MKRHLQPVEPGHALIERLAEVEVEALGQIGEPGKVGQVGLVGAPEIKRIGQPGADHLAVAAHDLGAAVAGRDIGDQHEMVGQPARRAIAGGADEAFLIGADGEPDDFGGNLEEIRVEVADQNDRPFDQPGDLLEQRLVLDQLHAAGKDEVLCVGQDDRLAAVRVEHDLGGLQLGDEIVEAAHHDRARRMETVAERDIARANPVDLEVDDDRLLGLRPEGAQDRLQRPHPAQRPRPGRSGSPAHRFRPWKGADHLRQQLGQDRLGRTPRPCQAGDIELALARVAADLGLGQRGQAGALQEALHRRLRRLGARPLALLDHIARAGGQPAHVEHQPPRRPIGARRLASEPGRDQAVGDQLAQVAAGLALHARRNFFGS